MSNPIYRFLHHHYHTRYHGIYRHAKKLFVFDLVLLASAVFMLGAGLFFFFWKPSLTDLIDLNLTLGADRIKSGELVALGVTYQNRTKFNLTDAVLSVQLPDGFEIDRNKTPETDFSNQSTFDLDTVPPGAKGEKIIWGYFWTEAGEEERITSLLSYLPDGRTGREQKIGVLVAKFPDSILKTEMIAPSAALPGQEIPLTIKITNQSDRTVAPVNVTVRDQSIKSYFKSSEPMGDLSLAPGETKTFNGTFILPLQPGKFDLAAETSVTVKSIYNFIQTRTAAPVNIAALPNFNLRAIWQAPSYLESGNEIPMEISWKNSGQKELKNPRLRLEFTPTGVVNLPTTARDNGWTIDGNDLLVDKTGRTALTNIKPGDEDKMTIKLKLLPKFNVGELQNVRLEVKPILEGELPDVPGQTAFVEGALASAPLATELTWVAQTRYFTPDGDQLGRGSLPPVVGEPTKYWIFIRVANTSNAVRDANFNATLSPGVQFTGKQSVTIGAPIGYDDKTGNISWRQQALPANSVTGLYFELSVSPTPDQIGQSLTLIKNLRFGATDNWTEKTFSLTASDLTNILPVDDQGSEMGYKVTAQ